eukprot:XP_001704105.1 Hypothetical protein GL50803_33935 [Giardia lamblia ATCC 50803]
MSPLISEQSGVLGDVWTQGAAKKQHSDSPSAILKELSEEIFGGE